MTIEQILNKEAQRHAKLKHAIADNPEQGIYSNEWFEEQAAIDAIHDAKRALARKIGTRMQEHI